MPTVQAVFATENPLRLSEAITQHWSTRRLVEFLAAPDAEAACWAARCLGIVGEASVCAPLVLLLRSSTPAVVAEAERALWMVWVRAGSAEGIARLHAASDCLRHERYREAARRLAALVADEPDYAEAHHQLAVALNSLGDLVSAADGYGRTIELNPYHYPALAGLGHLAVAGDRYAEALEYYRRALAIHPNLAELREVLPDLEQAVARRVVA